MPSSYINRELSWIEFNQRVLDEAKRDDKPLLERLKFLAITSANTDEFFQVRVGGLTLLKNTGSGKKDISGMTALQQLAAVRKRIRLQINEQYTLLNHDILPSLEECGIHICKPKKLPVAFIDQLHKKFTRDVLPLLTPLTCEETSDSESRISLPAMKLIVACSLRDTDKKDRTVLVPITEGIDRFILIGEEKQQFVLPLEDVIARFSADLFPEETILSHSVFRITRNGDIALQEEDVIDIAGEMEEVLSARKSSQVVRLEISKGTSRPLEQQLIEITGANRDQIFKIDGPLSLCDFMPLAFIPGYDSLKAEIWEPQPSPEIDPHVSMFEQIAHKDILLHHPYQSFDPVVRFIEEAASDPNVLAIKQVLYRTAKDSRIVSALILAAENGKQVTALVEIKARFDEGRNLHRADELQRAGVQIVYGVKGLKTHAKITLVVRKEAGALKRYCHFGTGNYNESTAKIYTDVSLLTAHSDFGADASLVFNAITGRSMLNKLKRLVPAPTHMKKRLLELIASETARARSGSAAAINAKFNSLQDQDIIDALYKASKAGVIIQLNVRGICCLKTGSGKDAKNIKVVSIIDHYLEHARIFHFHQGGDDLVFIASADWMTRNLEKRIELMIPVIAKDNKARLIEILKSGFKDNQQAHLLLETGASTRIQAEPDSEFRLQESMQKRAEKEAKAKSRMRSTTFEPHRPASS